MAVVNPRVMHALLMQDPLDPGGLPVGLFGQKDITLDAMGSAPARLYATDGSQMAPRATARALGDAGIRQSEAEASRMAAALAAPDVALAANYAPGPVAFSGEAAVPGSLSLDRAALPVEVAAPVAQAVQRGNNVAGGGQRRAPRPAAPPVSGKTPVESSPAAGVANASDKQTFDGVENTWDFWERPDMGYIQNHLMGLEKDPWNQADAQLAARVATGTLASVVGIPLLAAALNELAG